MSMMPRVFAVLVAVIALFAVPALGVGAPPSGSGKIVFSSNRSGTWQIYIMDLDGTHVTRLTNLPGDNWSPVLSPDGRLIAFVSYRREHGGDQEIYIMNADGSNVRRLTNLPIIAEAPAFSPDSRRIVFVRLDAGLIYIMNADGSNLTGTGQFGSEPVFSLDGHRILFMARGPHGTFEQITLMNEDGTHITPVGMIAGLLYADPHFSPDGRRIAFVDQRRGEDASPQIYVMDADGSNRHRLTNDQSWDHRSPIFTSDGRRITFASQHGWVDSNGFILFRGDWQIYMMDTNGRHERRLTSASGQSIFHHF